MNSSSGFAVYPLCIFEQVLSLFQDTYFWPLLQKRGGGGLDELCPETFSFYISYFEGCQPSVEKVCESDAE